MRAPILSLLLLTGVSACVLGHRGVVALEADYPLTGIDAIRLELPDTPLTIVGSPTATSLSLSGYWSSVGGSQQIAADNVTAPALDFARDGRFAILSAIIPLAARDLVDLELTDFTMPADRDLEIWSGLGDIQVAHVEGNISIDLDAGHIEVFGGAGGVGVRTGAGDLEIISTGNVSGSTRSGQIHVVQEGVGGGDIVMSALYGDIDVELAADANLDLQIAAGGDIRVQTSTVSTVTSRRFVREVGNGAVKIWLEAPYGRVTVRLREQAAP
jgi:hypothetical protein